MTRAESDAQRLLRAALETAKQARKRLNEATPSTWAVNAAVSAIEKAIDEIEAPTKNAYLDARKEGRT